MDHVHAGRSKLICIYVEPARPAELLSPCRIRQVIQSGNNQDTLGIYEKTIKRKHCLVFERNTGRKKKEKGCLKFSFSFFFRCSPRCHSDGVREAGE